MYVSGVNPPRKHETLEPAPEGTCNFPLARAQSKLFFHDFCFPRTFGCRPNFTEFGTFHDEDNF